MTESILEESKRAKGKGLLGFLNFKSKKFYIFAGIIVIAAGAYYYFSNTKEEVAAEKQQQVFTVKRGDITTAVEAEGSVVAEDGVELSFSVSGDTLEVEDVFVKEGDVIKKGDKIASVKSDDLEYDLRKAYVSYESALADYNEKLAGASDEDIEKAEASVESAQISLDQQKISLEKTEKSAQDSIEAAERAVVDAKERLDKNPSVSESQDVRDKYDDLVNSIKSINISLEGILIDSDEILGIDNESINDNFESLLGVKNATALSSARSSYNTAKRDKEELNQMVIVLNSNSDFTDIDAAASQAEDTLAVFEQHLYHMKTMLDATITATGLTQNQLDSFIATINSNRSNINSKISTLSSDVRAVTDVKDTIDDYQEDYDDALDDLESAKTDAEQDIANAESNLRSRELSLRNAQISYDELIAPLTDSEMASARSAMTTASINMDKAKDAVADAVLVSPIDGTVARLNYMPGDIILKDSAKSMVEIINRDTLFIEVDIEEADINKLDVGQKAVATFDALDDVELVGEISFISLTSETSNNGIVTYQVRVLFENSGDSGVREGMTAYVEFITSGVEDVLLAPVDAVRNVDGKPSVLTESGEWKPVTTGFTDGKQVEIISGIAAGEKIIY